MTSIQIFIYKSSQPISTKINKLYNVGTLGCCHNLLGLLCLLLLRHDSSLLSSLASHQASRPSLQLHCIRCLRYLLRRILSSHKEILHPCSRTGCYLRLSRLAPDHCHHNARLASSHPNQFLVPGYQYLCSLPPGRRRLSLDSDWLRYSFSRLPGSDRAAPQFSANWDYGWTCSESILRKLHFQGFWLQGTFSSIGSGVSSSLVSSLRDEGYSFCE